MFEFREQRYPRKWKEMSWDMRLMFVYHGCMMALFATGGLGLLSVRDELAIAGLLATVLTLLSIHHRRRARWRWPGTSGRALLGAAGVLLLGGVFLYAATPMFPPNDPHALPWYLGGVGLIVFGLLQSVAVVQFSEGDFVANCRSVDQYGRESERPAAENRVPAIVPEPSWKRSVRGVFIVSFFAAWLSFLGFFYCFGQSFSHGSEQPNATQTEPLQDHGKTTYISRAEKHRIDVLERISMIGIPVCLIGAFALHFLAGVKLYANTPTLAEYLARRRSEAGQARPL